MRFKYSAKTKDGKQTRKGEIDAPDQKSAINLLREKKLIVYSLVPTKQNDDVLEIFSKLKGISLNDKVKFTEQLSNMVTAGLSITKALEIIIAQTKNKNFAKVLEGVLADLEAGTSLSKSVSKYPKIFDQTYVSLIQAGESSGKLDKVLQRLAETLEKKRLFISKVRGAMIYPAIITVTMVIVFIIIIVFVIPQMTSLYTSLDVNLPMSTKILISISDLIKTKWWLILAVIALVVIGFKYFKSTREGQYILSKVIFKLPIFGNLVKQSNLVEFTMTLALLMESGVSIIDSLEIVKNTFRNLLFRDSVYRLITEVKHGIPLSQAVSKEEIYPPLVSNMLVVGEETGTVDQRLKSLAVYFENEVDKIVKNLSTAMEPIIMITLGIMVALLIFSVITPIYQLTSQF